MPTASASKILLLGIDGLDPKLTRKYLDQGKMPNTQKLLDRGAARQDLKMLGGVPTVTPPMWTTMATGCYANVHGIVEFNRTIPEMGYEYMGYNLDSRYCKAEPLWNVLAEAGKKTLVYTWPGSSWPPTSDNPNLHVVDGTTPEAVNCGVAQKENEFVVRAGKDIKEVTFNPAIKTASADIPCVIHDLEAGVGDKIFAEMIHSALEVHLDEDQLVRTAPRTSVPLYEIETVADQTNIPFDVVLSPIKEAHNWADAPADAKEFTVIYSKGLIRRPGLITKDETGAYAKVSLYKSKKETEPMFTLGEKEFVYDIIDDCIKDDVHYETTRLFKVMNLTPDGDNLTLWVSAAMDIHNDSLWHPRHLYKDVVEAVGYPTPMTLLGGQLIFDTITTAWNVALDYQAEAMHALMKKYDYDVVFSQAHNIDNCGHLSLQLMKNRPNSPWPEEKYQEFMEYIYCVQTDEYIGKFLHLLDEGWTVFLISDHGQVCSEYSKPFVNGLLMDKGYTVLKKDENGEPLREIDYTKTTAVAWSVNSIYLCVKGRDPFGIVEPEDKWELEERIMTDLYGWTHPVSGHRVVSVALRNKDAVVLGYGGPDCGDIVYWMAEGYNIDHVDSLPTTEGYADTSVGPIFIAAGPGIKQGYTDRIIRQVDVVPTVAFMAGVRVPDQCEGAPIYQIMEQY